MSIISGFQYLKQMKNDQVNDQSIDLKKIKNAICLSINGNPVDLSQEIDTNATIEIITTDDSLGLNIMRHTMAHVMAQAIGELYPEAKFAIGPTIENGFYYDILLTSPLKEDQIPLVEKKMQEIIKRDEKVNRIVLSKNEAIKIFQEKNQQFKVEILNDLDCDEVTIYKHGEFFDLCRGPHCPSTNISKAFKIMKLAGAYWKGDSKNVMLQRIYATAWPTQEKLDEYLKNLEEIEKRDHRKIGKAMELFHLQDEAIGCIFWHPNGWTLFKLLKEFIFKAINSNGYQEVQTPQMVDRTLWEKSGHWEKFKNNMFISEDETHTLAIKPMNCPGHVQIFKQSLKSYKDLPLRYAEFGLCHRNEPSGALYGTMRVRAFTCDDGHIFCTKEQVIKETQNFCELLTQIYKKLGFEKFHVRFSDRPELRAGTDEIWDLSESLLQKAASDAGLHCTLNKGEGAFYGPKLEFVLLDKLGREWQCGTLQCDFVLPERLDINYIGEDGNKHRPILLHRAILGSLERFIGILLENYAGQLPLWLSPVQVTIANVTNDFDDFAINLNKLFLQNDIRSTLDIRSEKVSYKIRELTLKKIPIIIVVGEKEKNENKLTLRYLNGEQVEMTTQDFINMMKTEGRIPSL